MSRDPRLFFDDIGRRCEKVLALSADMTVDSFSADELRHEALLRHMTIIGEAVKAIPDDVRNEAPEIPWRKIAGLRDLLVHVYFGIKDDIIFEIIQRDVPVLLDTCRSLLAKLESR